MRSPNADGRAKQPREQTIRSRSFPRVAQGYFVTSTQLSVGVFTTDTHLVIQVWDGVLARLTGIDEETACGQGLTALLPDLEKRGLLKRFQRSLNDGVVEVLATAFHHYLIPCAPVTPVKHFEKMQQLVTIAPL